ncbi:MAG: MBL fold metallo-hydrolase [Gammaproteobacteria bacterium]|nr:MBL fold metallo-hydrolase [Gammaproteobacteria bacterium]
MNLIRFIDPDSKTQSYLIYSLNGHAVIIDPVYQECEKYLDKLKQLDLKLLYSLDTHIHADHITGAAKLKRVTNCKIMMGKEANLSKVDVQVADREELSFDNISLQAIYTPGHTIESYCYLINSRLFTGDCLLINACGRTDFQNGSAYQQYDSIFNKLLVFPDETLVYPGHDYNNRTVSTILEERTNNPRLQVQDVKAFANIMNNLNLPRPKLMDVAVPRNLNCGEEVESC